MPTRAYGYVSEPYCRDELQCLPMDRPYRMYYSHAKLNVAYPDVTPSFSAKRTYEKVSGQAPVDDTHRRVFLNRRRGSRIGTVRHEGPP